MCDGTLRDHCQVAEHIRVEAHIVKVLVCGATVNSFAFPGNGERSKAPDSHRVQPRLSFTNSPQFR